MAKTYAHTTCENHYQVMTWSRFQTTDGSWTPKASPLAYTTSEVELKFPTNAVEVVLYASTDIRIKETSGGTSYYVLPANQVEVIQGAKLAEADGSIYFIRDSANGTVNFRFNIL